MPAYIGIKFVLLELSVKKSFGDLNPAINIIKSISLPCGSSNGRNKAIDTSKDSY